MKPWLAYSLVRVGIFALVFAALMLIGVAWYWAAIIAAVVGLCIAYIFFGKLRDAVALDIVKRRAAPSGDADSIAEDVE